MKLSNFNLKIKQTKHAGNWNHCSIQLLYIIKLLGLFWRFSFSKGLPENFQYIRNQKLPPKFKPRLQHIKQNFGFGCVLCGSDPAKSKSLCFKCLCKKILVQFCMSLDALLNHGLLQLEKLPQWNSLSSWLADSGKKSPNS